MPSPPDLPGSSTPETFAVEDYFEGRLGVTRGGKNQRVVVDFQPEAAEVVTTRTWHRSQKISRRPGGNVRLTFEIDDLKEILSWVLSWGPLAVVREPSDLVSAATRELRAAVTGYSKSH